MIQLTYEPAFDAFHAAFRFLRLRDIIAETGPLHRDHARIMDFYQLFPHRIEGIRFAPAHRKYRGLARKYQSKRPYGEQPDDRLLFDRMAPIQLTALDTLASQEILDPKAWSRGEVASTEKALPDVLSKRVDQITQAESDIQSFLRSLASEYALTGANGLKARTGLMEHRHDAP
jgi:hypothetical protein